MAFSNGRLPDSALAPIPGGRLRKDAAAAWNAMCKEAQELGMAVPMPDGADSTYRPYDRQVYFKKYWCDRGACQNAAEPGTSRHGWGIAVDCAEDAIHHAETIDRIGEKYGWSKKWSDAPWEPWHNTFKDSVRFPKWKPHYKLGSYGPNVRLLTGRLQHLGYLNRRYWRYTGQVESAIRSFQHRNHLKVDGVAGPMTWYAIKRMAIAKPYPKKK